MIFSEKSLPDIAGVRHLLAACFAALSLASATAAPVDVGAAAPAFSLTSDQGNVSLGQYAGKLVYLDFWASWCTPCRKSFPWMNDMQAKYGASGLQVIAVNVDANSEDAKNFLAQHPARFAVAFDSAGKTPQAYGIVGMPSSFIIGPDGRILFSHAGFKEVDEAALEHEIKQALNNIK